MSRVLSEFCDSTTENGCFGGLISFVKSSYFISEI